MKTLKVTLLLSAVFGLICSAVFAESDVERGKALFNDQKLGGGIQGRSCSSCHKDGRGLESIAEKTEFRAMGKTYKSLEDIINYFIVTAQKGKAIDPKSEQMKDLIAYVKSIGSSVSDKPK